MRLPEEKIISRTLLKGISSTLKKSHKKIVTTNGCFDLLHLGHLEYLRQARLLGDVLLVFLNSDSSVRELKGPKRPLQEEQTRALQLAALEAVDYVCLFEEETPEKVILDVAPAIHVKGGDYEISQLKEKSAVEKGGGEIKILPLVSGFSTTALIAKIQQDFSTP